MPELPEVEHLRRVLTPSLIGAVVESVHVERKSVVRGSSTARALLRGARIRSLKRKGKQLAIEAEDSRAILIQLGMSGGLEWAEPKRRLSASAHAHIRWRLRTPGGEPRRLIFRDPRRFGGVTTFDVGDDLHEKWGNLGPDAITIRAPSLRRSLRSTGRAVKTALLDQRVLAGVGNIYADEALHSAGIAPTRESCELTTEECSRLASSVRRTLRSAIRAGGSTIRDFADVNGEAGGHQQKHLVYGRAGQACRTCEQTLIKATIAQRTTVWCACCQQ